MHRIGCLVLALIVSPFVTTARSQNANTEADIRELSRLEDVWNRAHVEGDVAALAALWADDLEVAVPRMPVLTKSAALSFQQSARMKFQRYQTEDLHIRVYGETAVVTGRLQRTRAVEGRSIDDDWRFTKVYVRRGGQWQVVAFHASDAPPQR